MAATMTERLDELLSMASETGRLASQLAAAEKDAEYPANSWRGKNGRYFVRKLREELVTKTVRLGKSRVRFLADLNPNPNKE